MTRFVLSLLPDDRAILTTQALLTQREVHELKLVYDGWLKAGGLAIIGDCRVQWIESIDLLLTDDALVPA